MHRWILTVDGIRQQRKYYCSEKWGQWLCSNIPAESKAEKNSAVSGMREGAKLKHSRRQSRWLNRLNSNVFLRYCKFHYYITVHHIMYDFTNALCPYPERLPPEDPSGHIKTPEHPVKCINCLSYWGAVGSAYPLHQSAVFKLKPLILFDKSRPTSLWKRFCVFSRSPWLTCVANFFFWSVTFL